jgi:pterin-4a-carbinolamine dehydratase
VRSLEKLLSKINRHVDEPREMLSESSMLAFTDDSQLTPIEPSKESPWERTGDIYKERLERIYEFKNLRTLIYFMNESLKFQEKINHHAMMTINHLLVKIELHTTSLNQVTQQDLKLSAYFDELYEDTQYFNSVEF